MRAIRIAGVDELPQWPARQFASVSRGSAGGWLIEFPDDPPDAASSLVKALALASGDCGVDPGRVVCYVLPTGLRWLFEEADV